MEVFGVLPENSCQVVMGQGRGRACRDRSPSQQIKVYIYILDKRRAGDIYLILKLERNARVLNRIKVELRVF